MVRTPGGHAPNIKNRSSKHLIPLTKMKPIYRSLSNAALNEWYKAGNADAGKEIQRREKNAKKAK